MDNLIWGSNCGQKEIKVSVYKNKAGKTVWIPRFVAKLLGDPERVDVAFNEDCSKIYIKASDMGNRLSKGMVTVNGLYNVFGDIIYGKYSGEIVDGMLVAYKEDFNENLVKHKFMEVEIENRYAVPKDANLDIIDVSKKFLKKSKTTALWIVSTNGDGESTETITLYEDVNGNLYKELSLEEIKELREEE